jgi:uncharacterized protein
LRYAEAVKRLVVLALLLAASESRGASFDCAKAKSKVEKLVCADAALSKLDEKLAVAFRNAASDWDSAYNSQREWLRETRDRCDDVACLAKVYPARIEELEHWTDPQPWSDAMEGMYLEPRRVLFVGEQEWEQDSATDCLSITRQEDGSARLKIESLQINGHMCNVDQAVRREGDGMRAIPHGESTCTLMVRAERGVLVVDDPEHTCRAECGARATLDGLTFRRSQRKPGACDLWNAEEGDPPATESPGAEK